MSIVETVATVRTTSRWGHHPCDYETCQQLKEYHWLLYVAYCQYKRLVTWRNKTKYKTGAEPAHIPSLVICNPYTGKLEFVRHGDPYRGVNLYLHVLDQYHKARTPVATPEEVVPLDLPQGWTEHLVQMRANLRPGC